MPKRALVTGATGFVGAVVARRLVAEGHDVHLWMRPGSSTWRLEGVEAHRHEVELTDETDMPALLHSAAPDWIFHLAAHGAYASQNDPERIYATNVLGTVRLVEAAIRQGFESFVNAGSSSEYGFTDHAPSEDELPEPNSDYAASKLSQTHYCRHRARAERAHIVTLRLYSVYGPYEEPSRFVPRLISAGLEGRLPPLAAPNVARDFVYTDDVARAFIVAAERRDVEPGAIYNLGTGRQLTLREAVDVARSALAIEAKPAWGTMRKRDWDTTCWRANPERISRELGFTPNVTFETGFSRFADWVRSDVRLRALYS